MCWSLKLDCYKDYFEFTTYRGCDDQEKVGKSMQASLGFRNIVFWHTVLPFLVTRREDLPKDTGMGWTRICFNCLILLLFALPPRMSFPIPTSPSPSGANSCYGCSEVGSVTIEGPLRRKTLLKEGRKPKVRWLYHCSTTFGFSAVFLHYHISVA